MLLIWETNKWRIEESSPERMSTADMSSLISPKQFIDSRSGQLRAKSVAEKEKKIDNVLAVFLRI